MTVSDTPEDLFRRCRMQMMYFKSSISVCGGSRVPCVVLRLWERQKLQNSWDKSLQCLLFLPVLTQSTNMLNKDFLKLL